MDVLVFPARQGAQVPGQPRSQKISGSDIVAAESFAGNQRAPDIRSAGVVLGQCGNERAVFGSEDGQIGSAIGRLCRLVVAIDANRREGVEPLPVLPEPLAEPDGVGFRTPGRAQPRFENDLREPDVGGHAEPFVNRGPLAEKAPVAAGVWREGVAAGGVVQYRPDGALQQERHAIAPFAQLAREQFTVEGSGGASIYPHGIARPVSLRGKRDERVVRRRRCRRRSSGRGG